MMEKKEEKKKKMKNIPLPKRTQAGPKEKMSATEPGEWKQSRKLSKMLQLYKLSFPFLETSMKAKREILTIEQRKAVQEVN